MQVKTGKSQPAMSTPATQAALETRRITEGEDVADTGTLLLIR